MQGREIGRADALTICALNDKKAGVQQDLGNLCSNSQR
jgi:hypothetical protein